MNVIYSELGRAWGKQVLSCALGGNINWNSVLFPKQKIQPNLKSREREIHSFQSSGRCHKVTQQSGGMCTSVPHMPILIARVVGRHLSDCKKMICFKKSLMGPQHMFKTMLVMLLSG